MLSQTFSDNPESWRFFKGKQASIFLMGKILGSHQSIGDQSAPLNGTFRQKASQMVSDRLRVRLEQREAVLRLLDRRRGQTGDPNLGSGMEKKILDLELADLETTMGIQESTERTVVRNIRPTRTDT
jgi:hypothetical protein